MEPAAPDVVPLLAPELLVATTSGQGDRTWANPAWEAVFGRERLLSGLSADDERFVREYLAEAASGSLITNQVFLVDRHGRDLPAPVLLNFIPVRLPQQTDGGDAARFPVVLIGEVLQEPTSWAADQTKRRRMEMLGQMAMGIAHDFNNLLTSILGHAELMKGELSGDGAPRPYALLDHLRSMERAASDGASLVRKIQRYIRHEKETRFAPINLTELIDEVVSLTRPYWQNEPRRQGISVRLKKELAPVPPIQGVETELREVLVNLVLNAVQAMPDGGALTLRTRDDGERGVVVEVEDTGIGIPESIRRRIFEPLFTTKGEEGSGMGLTVSYGIVQEHDGAINVVSEPGHGTRFTLRFPPSVEPAAAQRPSKKEAAVPQERRPARILVVDDEPMVRSVTAKLLRLRGHAVEEASGGEEALDKVSQHPFEMVITDLGMPGMSGRELAYKLRQHHPHLPILLLTGHTDAEDRTEHVDAVVKKPFQIDRLEALIQRVLGR
ncbi:MAG: response regulator [Rhodothermales bacterium]|nr:response regulator [Rhodothermales bacterium]